MVNRTGAPSKSSSMKAIAKVHSEDRTLELANILGMTLEQWLVALTLKEKVSKHDRWFNERSPHCLMIDCIYLIGKYTKNKNVKQTTIQKTNVGFEYNHTSIKMENAIQRRNTGGIRCT